MKNFIIFIKTFGYEEKLAYIWIGNKSQMDSRRYRPFFQNIYVFIDCRFRGSAVVRQRPLFTLSCQWRLSPGHGPYVLNVARCNNKVSLPRVLQPYSESPY